MGQTIIFRQHINVTYKSHAGLRPENLTDERRTFWNLQFGVATTTHFTVFKQTGGFSSTGKDFTEIYFSYLSISRDWELSLNIDYVTFNSGKKVKAGEKPKTYRIQWADSQDTAGCEQTFDGIPFHFGWVGVQCLSYSFHRWGTSVIQLCWQRSHKSVKAYSTIPICIMGSKSLVLLDWGSRWFSNKEQDRRNTRVCAVSFRHSETPWGSITQP